MPAGAPSPSRQLGPRGLVVACEPLPDWFVVDRYWAGARLKDIEALLIVNKSDLRLRRSCGGARQLSHPRPACAIEVSARTGAGLAGAAQRARGRRDAAGRTIGRRQILARQCARARRRGADRRAHARGGRPPHDDHGAPLSLSSGASPESQSAVIDAPGVRDFAPPASLARAAERGFVEIHRARRRLPLQRLPTSRGAAMRGAQCRARPSDLGAPLRELPPALSPVREARLLAQETRVRPASACASVPPSTYSSSPPTGTP
jgi:hypothetical protein